MIAVVGEFLHEEVKSQHTFNLDKYPLSQVHLISTSQSCVMLAGYTFGQDITESFNHTNGLDLVTRAHQLGKKREVPLLPRFVC